jgi:uncharacterized protein
MQLYAGSTKQFVQDAIQNQIAQKVAGAFFDYYGRNPPDSERRSWQNSLSKMSQVIQYADLSDNGVLVEYQLPLSSQRIDCLFTGHDGHREPHAVIVELKQWETCRPSDGEFVVTWTGGGNRSVLHPSVQAGQYRQYLVDSHTAFYEGEKHLVLDSCAYLHNYSYAPQDTLLEEKYNRFRVNAPIFTQDDVDPLASFLRDRLGRGGGLDLLPTIQQSNYRPSKKLMDHVGQLIEGKVEYALLDEQLIVYDQIRTLVRTGAHKKGRHAVIVKGGPGTGKSVIAIRTMADLLRNNYSTHYATGSKAFTETLRKIVGPRAGQLFRYFNSYVGAQPGEIDVLVMDEAHRIRKTSASRYTPASKRSGEPQIHELLRAARVGVFFIDDHQVVRPDEIGSADYIRQEAAKAGAEIHEFQLETQFRCAGSDAFVNWINSTLGIQKTANQIWEGHPDFEFKIMDSPQEMEAAVRGKVAAGRTGRIVSGFCFPWSQPGHDGLVNDIVIGDYERPWDLRYDATRKPPGVPSAALWAYDPRGIDQIGCVYTAQGFEFDYTGVIFGKDLKYDPKTGQWKGHKEQSHDNVVKRAGEGFIQHVKNVYRVLLSRSMKGCYVYFMDEDTRNFFRSRMG